MKGVSWRYAKIPLNIFENSWRFVSNVKRKIDDLDGERMILEMEELRNRTGKESMKIYAEVRKYAKLSKILTVAALAATVIFL